MINYIRGDIFSSACQTLVNPVNCVGVMGAGLALQFKEKYPDMFNLYKEYCNEGYLTPGKLWLWQGPDHWILNFPTKNDWKEKSSYDYIQQGLIKFSETYREKGITSIAFPMLGTGCGRLVKDDVKLLLAKYLSNCDIPIEVYELVK